jgi:hypothetical protein
MPHCFLLRSKSASIVANDYQQHGKPSKQHSAPSKQHAPPAKAVAATASSTTPDRSFANFDFMEVS